MLGSHVRATEGEITCTPVLESAIVVGELAALLTTVTLPVKLPAVAGAQITLKVVLCPAVKVSGGVRPLELKLAPEAVIWEILTLELPVLVRVTVCVPLLPTVTFPKLKEAGLAESCRIGATPVPLSATASGEPGALLTRERLPVALLATVGVKLTVNVVD